MRKEDYTGRELHGGGVITWGKDYTEKGLYGEGTTRGKNYTEKGLHEEETTRGRHGEGTTRGGNYTGKERHWRGDNMSKRISVQE